MCSDVANLTSTMLNIRTWQAFDVDAAGRVLAGWDDSGTVQLVEIDTDGTRTPLTALPGACSGRYIPGRREVVVQHDTDGNERAQLSTLSLSPLPAQPVGLDGLSPLVADPEHIHALLDVTADTLVYATNRRNDVDFDVMVRRLGGRSERTLYDDGGYVVGAALSHDGESVAITQLSLVPASSQVSIVGPRAAGPRGQVTAPDEHAMHGDLDGMGGGVAWAPGDRALIVVSNHEREFRGVARVDTDGQRWLWLLGDESADHMAWVAPDGASMVVGRLVDGAYSLGVYEVDGSRRYRLRLPADGYPTVVWSADGSRFAVTLTAPTLPGSIYLVEAAHGAVRTVADARADVDPDVVDQWTEPAVHRIPTPDGEEVPCFVYTPAAGADPAVEGACVLDIHGGPESAAVRRFNPVHQALVGAGLTVLVPNVRGSTGYGKRWYSLDDVDKRLNSVADLAAVHAYLPHLWLDQSRAAVWGGSYGGYMVLAAVSMQPQLWAAAVDIVGISSLVTFLENTSPYRRAYREREYGSLERDRAFLEKASPITYLDQIRAPLFVIHGANDPRVPLTEAEQITAALDRSGVPCELRVYDDEGHGLAKRANRLDAFPAAIAFLTRHLGSADPGS